MTPFLNLLLLLAATAALGLLPLAPALLELRRRSDAAPLAIIRDHDGHIRRFAAGLRQYLHEQGFARGQGSGVRGQGESKTPVLTPDPQPLTPVFEGELADGTPFLLIEAGMETADVPCALSELSAGRLIVSYRPLALPPRTVFLLDVFATGAIHGGEASGYRALLSDQAIHLARGSTVFRWVHSEDQLRVDADSILYGRASAERLLRLAAGCRFERLQAARIEFGGGGGEGWGVGCSVFGSGGSGGSPNTEHRTPHTPHPPPLRLEGHDVAGRRTRVRGDLTLPPGSFFAGDLVVTGQLRLGEGACIEGSVKSGKDLELARGAAIQGSVVSGRNIALGPDCHAAGPVIAERAITIEAGTQLGSADHPTTVCARRLFIHAGVVAFGSVRAAERGEVL